MLWRGVLVTLIVAVLIHVIFISSFHSCTSNVYLFIYFISSLTPGLRFCRKIRLDKLEKIDWKKYNKIFFSWCFGMDSWTDGLFWYDLGVFDLFHRKKNFSFKEVFLQVCKRSKITECESYEDTKLYAHGKDKGKVVTKLYLDSFEEEDVCDITYKVLHLFVLLIILSYLFHLSFLFYLTLYDFILSYFILF